MKIVIEPSYAERNSVDGTNYPAREHLLNSINKHKINTDRNVFIKTESERDLVKSAKLTHKSAAKHQSHILRKNQEETLRVILSSRINNWGGVMIKQFNY